MATATAVQKREEKGIVDVVADRVTDLYRSGKLHLPDDYSAENSMKAAWLTLQETKTRDGASVLQACSKTSIANALLDMVVQGLNPGRKQCYFLAFGKTLTCMRSYFGSMALVKRVIPGAGIHSGVVYEGDEFEYEINMGRKTITKHKQKLENIKRGHIAAAYCIIEKDGEPIHTVIMPMEQIKAAWQQGQGYKEGGNGVHQKFDDQMAQKVAIQRACKHVINSAADSELVRYVQQADDSAAEAMLESSVDEDDASAITIGMLDASDEQKAEEVQEEAQEQKSDNGEAVDDWGCPVGDEEQDEKTKEPGF